LLYSSESLESVTRWHIFGLPLASIGCLSQCDGGFKDKTGCLSECDGGLPKAKTVSLP